LVFSSGPECLDQEETPVEVQAWIAHATGDSALSSRLEDLASRLAGQPVPRDQRPAAPPAGQRRALLLAAAAFLLGVLAWRDHPPHPMPQAEPALPAPIAAPTPAPAAPVEIALEQAAPPAPPEPAPAPRRPARLARSFDGVGDGRPLTVLSGVDVVLDGHLELTGTPSSPRIALRGRATIDVTPGAVEDLVVASEGAQVHVLGTRFTVAEEAAGTSVSVERGKVSVTCVVGTPLQLLANQRHVCPKPSAAGMLVYIRQLEQAGGSQEEVLAAAERGLGYPVSQPVLRSSLQIERIEALAVLGREAETREAMRTCLESCEAVYQEKVQELARRLGLQP
jgi:ferric-dicitrate binding protein FerR (iron transport regulator)